MDSEALYLNIIDNLQDGVYFVDKKRKILFWNRAAERITGYKKEEMVGKFCHNNILNHVSKEGALLCVSGCPLYASTIDGEQRRDDVFLRHKNGHRVPVSVNIFPMYEQGAIVGAIEIFTVNAPKVHDDSSGLDPSMADKLTGLPNRAKAESFIGYKLAELKQFGTRFCVLRAEVDDYKWFTANNGDKLAEDMLKNIAGTYKRYVKKSDLIARLKDEIFIGIFDIKQDYESSIIAEEIRILAAATEVFKGAGTSLTITASVGVTIVQKDDNVPSILERVELLTNKSKSRGKNCVTSDLRKSKFPLPKLE
jgi:diguanylate cyclase (GGDEF)-like protein/PAS domain S-box-containing protein